MFEMKAMLICVLIAVICFTLIKVFGWDKDRWYCRWCKRETRQSPTPWYPDEGEPPIVRICDECGCDNYFFDGENVDI